MRSFVKASWLGCTVVSPHWPAASVELKPLILLQPMGLELSAACTLSSPHQMMQTLMKYKTSFGRHVCSIQHVSSVLARL